ncbi:MAG: DUF1893 domain-containing protein [Candidatus Bathyarchaeota archaeon]|nr:DUF1893 domain-containing protein [Candidatus Bathyarchaeota archaeon]
MNDLDIAKTQFHKKGLTLTIVKKGNVLFETASHGISGFLYAIKQFGSGLQGASVADRVVGKANALLCVYAGISEVYAEILSKKANAVFKENRIPCEWKELANNILNSNRSSICPFEKAVADISNPERAYAEFKALLKSFNSQN